MKKTVVKEFWTKKEIDTTFCDVCSKEVDTHTCENCGMDLCEKCEKLVTSRITFGIAQRYCPSCEVRRSEYDEVLRKLRIAQDRAYRRIMREGLPV